MFLHVLLKLFHGKSFFSRRVKGKNIVEVDTLCLVPAWHNFYSDESSELYGVVTLSTTSGLCLNRLDAEVLKFVNFIFIHRGQALNSVIRNATDVLFLKFGDIVHQGVDSLTTGEQGAHRGVDCLVGYWDAQHLVAGGHHTQGVVDEQFTTHQFVNEQFFHQ